MRPETLRHMSWQGNGDNQRLTLSDKSTVDVPTNSVHAFPTAQPHPSPFLSRNRICLRLLVSFSSSRAPSAHKNNLMHPLTWTA